MTDQSLAQLSNLAIYSAMVVLTLAMLADAVYLARLVPAREAAQETARERELVPAGAVDGSDPASGDSATDATGRDAEPLAARKAAGIGWTLTLLGTMLVVAGVVLRALEVHRWPLGNMYEFAIFGSMFVLLAYCGWAMRRDLRWLGLFVVPAPGHALDDELKRKIVTTLRTRLTARHVPDEILEAPAVPHTLSGKRLEVPIKKLLRGTPLEKAANPASVDDPDVLRWYARFAADRLG